jgi:pyruvate ferredoxin oxidoreductase gamma subunit
VLGALAKTGIVSVDSVTSAIQEMFNDERNVRVAEAAFREMQT